MINSGIIADTTVLSYFLKIKTADFENISRMIFPQKMFVPEQVASESFRFGEKNPEHAGRISRWLDRSNTSSAFVPCYAYDEVVLKNLSLILDGGEAAGIAQAEKRNLTWFFSDDHKNKGVLAERFPHIRQKSMFFIIACADVSRWLTDYEATVAEYARLLMYEKFNNTTKAYYRKIYADEYLLALSLKGEKISKAALKEKIDFNAILERRPIN